MDAKQIRKILLFASLGLMAVVMVVAIFKSMSTVSQTVPGTEPGMGTPGSTQLISSAPPPPQEIPKPPLLPVGTEAPPITLLSMKGQNMSLQEYKGQKLVLLEFFATWCPHCQETVPTMEKIFQQYGNTVQVLAVNAGDRPEDPPTSPEFALQHKIQYPILVMPPKQLLDDYRVVSFPTFYLVDRSGLIVWNHRGTLIKEPVAQELMAVLSQYTAH